MRSSTPQPKRGLARGLLGSLTARALLAFAFLFAQQTASLHWLSHAVDATHAKATDPANLKAAKSAPVPDHCDECLALGALGAGATSSSVELPTPAAQHALLASATPVASPATRHLAFRSRAPPSLV